MSSVSFHITYLSMGQMYNMLRNILEMKTPIITHILRHITSSNYRLRKGKQYNQLIYMKESYRSMHPQKDINQTSAED
jgi:hypothetical protein